MRESSGIQGTERKPVWLEDCCEGRLVDEVARVGVGFYFKYNGKP